MGFLSTHYARPHTEFLTVPTRIVNGHPNSQIDDLLPWAYIRSQELKAVA